MTLLPLIRSVEALRWGDRRRSTPARIDEERIRHLPRGSGPIVLVGGFATSERKMRPMANALAELGYEPFVVCHRNGLDCSERSYGVLVAAVERIARTAGKAVTLLAFSRGGQFARVLAVRRPDLVHELVTLGTPFVGGLGPLRLGTRMSIVVLGILGSLGVRSVVTLGCLGSGCCHRFWQDLARPLPERIRLVSVCGADDRTVCTEASHDPCAEVVAVSGGHSDLINTVPALEAATRALAAPSRTRTARIRPRSRSER